MQTANKLLNAILESGDGRLEYASDYAEPGYSLSGKKGILFANWNSQNRYPNPNDRWEVSVDETMPRLAKIAEKVGYEIEWSDEWSTCSDCGKAVRTQPDGWDWEPSYHVSHGEMLCSECHEQS